MNKAKCLIAVTIVATCLVSVAYFYRAILLPFLPSNNSELAAWVGALGSVGAVFAAIWVMNHQHIVSEKRIVDERAHAAQKQINEARQRIAMSLMIAGHAASGILSSLKVLDEVKEEDLQWTLFNQAKFMARVSEPTFHMPMHELETIKLVELLFNISDLAQRLTDCIAAWSYRANNSLPYIPDLKETVALLKPEAAKALSSLEQYAKDLNN